VPCNLPLYPETMPLVLPPGPFRAYLFDMDGTIADSMPLHYLAWKEILAEYGCPLFPEPLFYSWGGMPVREIVAALNQRHALSMPVEEVARRKEGLYFEMLPRLTAVPEVLEQIEEAHSRIPFAVVSGSTRESVLGSLRALHLEDKFDVLVCAGDYKNAKPDPEPFLLAAQKLGVPAASCLVFEDTAIGIEAATRAGMQSVRILQPWERKQAEAVI